jgi:hypothetical protein
MVFYYEYNRGFNMRVGDKDGLDEVYDGNGELILQEDEELILKEENVVPGLKTTWRKFGGKDVMDSVMGRIYITSRRLVFISTPENISRIGTESNGGMASFKMDSAPKVDKLKGMDKSSGVRDYFEFMIKELLACEIKSGVVSAGEQINTYVLAAGKQYHMTFLGKEDSDLLKKFQNNTIENVEELVQNLKKHYENTDWIFS